MRSLRTATIRTEPLKRQHQANRPRTLDLGFFGWGLELNVLTGLKAQLVDLNRSRVLELGYRNAVAARTKNAFLEVSEGF